MKDNSVAIFIPARLNSSRFPKKVLHMIDEKPLIIHVLERAKSIGLCECYVACCSNELKDVVEQHDGKAILTDPNLPSGTDRVFAAVETLKNKPEYIINLQGDTPVFEPKILTEIFNVLKNDPEIDMTTPVTLSSNTEDFHNRNVVKVVFNNMEKVKPGKALYFSRSHIPHGSTQIYTHMGMYAYRYNAMKKFVNLEQTYLEKTESLEQLRAIQNNMNVYAVPVDGNAIAVDVPSDVEVVKKYLHG